MGTGLGPVLAQVGNLFPQIVLYRPEQAMILSRLLGNLRSLKAISMGDSFGKKFVAGVMIVLVLSMFLGVPINIFWNISPNNGIGDYR